MVGVSKRDSYEERHEEGTYRLCQSGMTGRSGTAPAKVTGMLVAWPDAGVLSILLEDSVLARSRSYDRTGLQSDLEGTRLAGE